MSNRRHLRERVLPCGVSKCPLVTLTLSELRIARRQLRTMNDEAEECRLSVDRHLCIRRQTDGISRSSSCGLS